MFRFWLEVKAHIDAEFPSALGTSHKEITARKRPITGHFK